MIKIKESNFCYIKLNITLNKLIIISILLRVIVWISAASLPKWLRKLNFEKQQPMQTFNPKNLTFCTWRSIYLNIKEASWPIALRFGDSHLEHFQHFHVRLHEKNYYPIGNMGFLLVTRSADQLMCRCKNKMVDLRSREVYKCCTY